MSETESKKEKQTTETKSNTSNNLILDQARLRPLKLIIDLSVVIGVSCTNCLRLELVNAILSRGKNSLC